MSQVRIALVQMLSDVDPARNLALVADKVAEAARRGAEVVVFPEATMARFGIPLRPISQPVDGPWADEVRRIAAEAGVLVVAGMFTPADGERVYNTLLVTGRGVDTYYHKIHLYDAFGFTESTTVAPGRDAVTVAVDGVTFGIATCYDVRFPALFTHLASRGASVILLPASWGAGPGKVEQWEVLVRARALDSTSWVVAADQADPAAIGVDLSGGAPTGVGHSLVVTPTGEIHASTGAKPELLMADIDPERSAKTREIIPVLVGAHRFD